MPRGSASARRAWALSLALLFVAALLFYAATLLTHLPSDGIQLIGMVAQPSHLHYNLLYLPLGWLLHLFLGARAALEWLSVLSGASALVLIAATLRRLGHPLGASLALVILAALTPVTWIFCCAVEVHAVQFLGAAAGVYLAVVARERGPRGALALTLAGAAIAVAAHLSCVLLVPALFVLASRSEPGRGLALRSLALPATVLIALASGLVWMVWQGWALQGVGILRAAATFSGTYLGGLLEGRFFSPAEVGVYLEGEVLAPLLAILVLFPLALCWHRRGGGRLAGAAALALVSFALPLSQGGVWEVGAYYISLVPLAAIAGAEVLARIGAGRGRRLAIAAVLAACIPQVWMGRALRAELERGPRARQWAAAIVRRTPPGTKIFTDSIPRWHALCEAGRPDSLAIPKLLDIYPAAYRAQPIGQLLLDGAGAVLGGRVFLVDARILDDGERAASVRAFAAALRRQVRRFARLGGARLEPLSGADGAVLAYRLILAARGAPAPRR